MKTKKKKERKKETMRRMEGKKGEMVGEWEKKNIGAVCCVLTPPV